VEQEKWSHFQQKTGHDSHRNMFSTQICIKPKVPSCKKGCCRFLSVCKTDEDKAAAAKNKSPVEREGKEIKQYVESNRERCIYVHVRACTYPCIHVRVCVCVCGESVGVCVCRAPYTIRLSGIYR
jgi:hypothetical protein